jgi:hypothetical protein
MLLRPGTVKEIIQRVLDRVAAQVNAESIVINVIVLLVDEVRSDRGEGFYLVLGIGVIRDAWLGVGRSLLLKY